MFLTISVVYSIMFSGFMIRVPDHHFTQKNPKNQNSNKKIIVSFQHPTTPFFPQNVLKENIISFKIFLLLLSCCFFLGFKYPEKIYLKI